MAIIKYVGSKNKLSKELVPIIQSYITENTNGYLEICVGGANMIDKIKHENKIGCDIHKYLIALLKHIQLNTSDVPLHISEDEYKSVKDNKNDYPDWYVGLVGFCATFSSKWFGGYARGFKADGVTPRDLSNEAIRNLLTQSSRLNNIKFINKSFLDLPKDKIKGYVIYCDPPYRGTLKYATEEFPYEEYYEWCKEMSKDNIVLCSEYNMPNDFECVWQKEHKTQIDSKLVAGSDKNIRIEKLYTYKRNL